VQGLHEITPGLLDRCERPDHYDNLLSHELEAADPQIGLTLHW